MITSENPLGLDGFAFCEFTSPEPVIMAEQFLQLGFVAAARRPDRDMILFRQGRIAFLLNSSAGGQASAFGKILMPPNFSVSTEIAKGEVGCEPEG